MAISFLYRVENIVGKGEKASYQHFPFPFSMFSKDFSLSFVKRQDYVEKD